MIMFIKIFSFSYLIEKKTKKYVYIISKKLKSLKNSKKKKYNKNSSKNFPSAFKKLFF